MCKISNMNHAVASDISCVQYYQTRLCTMTLDSIRFYGVLAAIVIYGGFGSPTPDNFGIVEGLIGGIFAVSLPWLRIFENIKAIGSNTDWAGYAALSALYILCIGICASVMNGAAISLVIRDCVAFMFLLLPIFLWPLFKNHPDRVFPFILGCVACGFLFGVRSLSAVFEFDVVLILGQSSPLFYLANSPLVLFTAILTALFLCRGLLNIAHVSLLKFTILSVVLLVCLAAMIVTLQRASIGLFMVSVVIYIMAEFVKSPYRALPVMICIACAGIGALSIFGIFIETLVFKNRVVGDNMRLQEWSAVWAAVSHNPISIIFGLGLGGTFESPAVGNMNVNYTHGLLGSLVLKTGVVGVVLIGLYLVALARKIWMILRAQMIVGLALLAPFMIDVFLYASFKSLEFGLLLTAIIVICANIQDFKAFRTLIFRVKYS